MTIPADEAASALRDAEAAAGRSTRFQGYREASGFLILWGAIWAVMDVGYYFGPQAGNWVSLAGDAVGISGSVWLGVRLRRTAAGRTWRGATSALLIAAAIGLYSLGLSAIVPMQGVGQGQAVAGVSVGCAYMVLGAVRGLRLAAVGAAMIGLTLAGWLYAPHDHFMLWMAFAGGGGLMLSGLWLRTA